MGALLQRIQRLIKRHFRQIRDRDTAFVASHSGTLIFDRRGGASFVSIPIAQAPETFDDILRTYNNLVCQGFEEGSEDAAHAIRLLEYAEDCAFAIAQARRNQAKEWTSRAFRRIEHTTAMRLHWRDN